MKITKTMVDNLEILDYLKKVVENHPDLRFAQLLEIIYDPDKKDEKPLETLSRIKTIIGSVKSILPIKND